MDPRVVTGMGAAVLALLVVGRLAFAEVAGLRVTNDRSIDASSIDRIIDRIIKPGMTDREKAVAVWKFAADCNYFYPTPYEAPGEDSFAYGVVTDVIKLINVYGFAYCFQHRSLVEALAEAAGLEGRSGGIGGHCIPEVFYDGRYHYLDSSQKCYCLLPDGKTIASRDQVADDPLRLMVNQKRPSDPYLPGAPKAILPYEDKHILASYFFLRNFYLQHNKYRTGHSMNLTLPDAGRVTWHFKGVGKWHQRSPDKLKWELENFGHYNPFDGPAERHGKRTYANVAYRFRPDLAKAGQEFVEALSVASNVGIVRGGLVRTKAGAAYADLRVRLPYVICGWPTVLEPEGKPSGAAVISGSVQCYDGGRLRVLLSTDEGVTWTEIWRVDKPRFTEFAVDVSPHVTGRYAFQVRIEFGGRPNATRLETIAFDVSGQAAQWPLPALVPGRNRIALDLGDETKVVTFGRHFKSEAELKRYAHEVKNMKVAKWNIHPPTGQTGEVTFRVAAPPLHELAWLSVGGSMRTSITPHHDEALEILVSAGGKKAFKPAWQSDVAPDTEHWCYEVDQRVDLPAGTRVAYVKYRMKRTGEGAVGVPRIVAHYRRARRSFPKEGLRVTYRWRENGQPKSHERIVKSTPAAYTITVPKDATVEMDQLTVEAVRPGRAALGEPDAQFTRKPKLRRRSFRDPVKVPALQADLKRIRERFEMPTLLSVFATTKSPVLKAQVVPVIAMLGVHANPAVAERILTDATKDKDKAVADRAKGALVQFHRALPDDAQVAALRHGKADRRALAAEVIGERRLRSAADALAPLLADKVASVRSAAGLALARLGDERAVGALIEAMNAAAVPEDARKSDLVLAKLPFAVSLLAVDDDSGGPVIDAARTSADRYLRYQLITLLGDLAGSKAEPLLVEALADDWSFCRRAAVVALARHGTKATLARLRRLAKNDPVAWVRSEAVHAVRRVEGRDGS